MKSHTNKAPQHHPPDFLLKHRLGLMTMVFTDMVGSTELKQRLGDQEAMRLIRQHHQLVRNLLAQYPRGEEINTSGDSFFLAFATPSDAVKFALQLQAQLRRLAKQTGHVLRDRIGIHVGEVFVEDHGPAGVLSDLNGMQVDTCARVMSLAGPDHILLTRFAFENARQMLRGARIKGVGAIDWKSHGLFEVKGINDPVEIYEVGEPAHVRLDSPVDSEKAKRLSSAAGAGPEILPDLPPATFRERWRAHRPLDRRLSRLGAALGALLGVLLLMTFLGEGLVNLSYDLAYLFRSPVHPEEVVLVEMDDESHEELRQPKADAWDRSYHARLVERLQASGARAVVFDIYFSGTNKPEADRQFIRALTNYGRAVIAGTASSDQSDVGVKWSINPPWAGFRSNGIPWGLVEKAKGEFYCRLPTRGAEQKLSLAETAARLVGSPYTNVPAGSWMNFYAPAGRAFSSRSYAQALTTNVPDSYFSNRVVFVGAREGIGYTGGHGTDYLKSPYNRWSSRRMPGVEINATSFVNLIRDDWLRRPAPWLELLIFLLIGCGAGYFLPLCSPLVATLAGLGSALLLGLASMELVWLTHYWIPWLIIVVVQLPVTIAWANLAFSLRQAHDLKQWQAALRVLQNTAGAVWAQSAYANPPPATPAPRVQSE